MADIARSCVSGDSDDPDFSAGRDDRFADEAAVGRMSAFCASNRNGSFRLNGLMQARGEDHWGYVGVGVE